MGGTKLVKIEMTFDDGKVQTLEGEDAARWQEEVDGCIDLAFVHGVKLSEHNWRVLKDGGAPKC